MSNESDPVKQRAREARAFLEKKEAGRSEHLRQSFERAWRDFEAIVSLIIENYAPKRIYQWGSLLDEGTFSEISDIDVALEGVTDPAVFLKLANEAEELTSFPLDIVQMECIHPLHAEDIRRKGRLVYERK